MKLLPSRFALIYVKENFPATVRVLNGDYVFMYIIATLYVTYRKETSTFVDKKVHKIKYAAGVLLRSRVV